MDDSLSISEMIEIRPYLNVLYELIEIDFSLTYFFITEKELPNDVPLKLSYPYLISYFFKYYYNNNKNNKKKIIKQLQKGYTYMKFKQKIGPLFNHEMWYLIKKYYQGREDGRYNTLKSFVISEELSESDAQYFKNIYRIFMGYYHAFKCKT